MFTSFFEAGRGDPADNPCCQCTHRVCQQVMNVSNILEVLMLTVGTKQVRTTTKLFIPCILRIQLILQAMLLAQYIYSLSSDAFCTL